MVCLPGHRRSRVQALPPAWSGQLRLTQGLSAVLPLTAREPHDRAIRRAFKLRRRLGSEGGIGQSIRKPKGMRWATFEREMAQVEAAETLVNGYTVLLVRRLTKR